MGFSLLEVVNYMEHYGMLRQKVGAPGKERYERVDPSHSWNSNNIATNVLLYHLQRHSDHHANPTRRYQTLRDFEESPVLPTGYAGMIVLAIVPAVWRRVMDQRVVDHFGRGPRRELLGQFSRQHGDGVEAGAPPGEDDRIDRLQHIVRGDGDEDRRACGRNRQRAAAAESSADRPAASASSNTAGSRGRSRHRRRGRNLGGSARLAIAGGKAHAPGHLHCR